ncbi:hypothetical protein Dimus_021281 [Dionaea muscipula]
MLGEGVDLEWSLDACRARPTRDLGLHDLQPWKRELGTWPVLSLGMEKRSSTSMHGLHELSLHAWLPRVASSGQERIVTSFLVVSTGTTQLAAQREIETENVDLGENLSNILGIIKRARVFSVHSKPQKMMGDIFVFDSSNDAAPEGKRRGDDGLVRSSVGRSPKKVLLKDVTNLPQIPRLSHPDDKYKLISSFSTSEQIEQLLKDKMLLMKQVADRNKIIELSGMELQKSLANLQEVQQQNWHLARANSQMLAELNAGKDKSRMLQHELGCMKSLLAVKNFELQEKKKEKLHQQTVVGMQGIKSKEAGEASQVPANDNKPCRSRGRRLSKVAVTAIGEGVQTKEKSENRRLSLRRNSSTFKTEEMKSMENVLKNVQDVLTKGNSKNKRFSLRRQSCRFETEVTGSAEDNLFTTDNGILTKAKSENRRVSLGRKSSRFIAIEMESTEEIDDARIPVCSEVNDRKHDGDLIQTAPSVTKADTVQVNSNESSGQESTEDAFETGDGKFPLNDDGDTVEGDHCNGSATRDVRRLSLGRPMRRAAEKVQSYKEVPLNRKIRRLD